MKKGILFVPALFIGAAIALGAICIYNIPAWERAKATHQEAAFQSGTGNFGQIK